MHPKKKEDGDDVGGGEDNKEYVKDDSADEVEKSRRKLKPSYSYSYLDVQGAA